MARAQRFSNMAKGLPGIVTLQAGVSRGALQ